MRALAHIHERDRGRTDARRWYLETYDPAAPERWRVRESYKRRTLALAAARRLPSGTLSRVVDAEGRPC